MVIVKMQCYSMLCNVNGSQLAKMKQQQQQQQKKTFPTCPRHTIFSVEAVGLKSSNDTFKNYDFINM